MSSIRLRAFYCVVRSAATCSFALALLGCVSAPSAPVGLRATSDGYVVEATSNLPVYFYVLDKPGVSRCYEECLRFFRPVAATGEGLGAGFSVVDRNDGSRQLQFQGRPLYVSVSDIAGGQPRAQAVHQGWLPLQMTSLGRTRTGWFQ